MKLLFVLIFSLCLASRGWAALVVAESEECHVDTAAIDCTTSAVTTEVANSLFVCNAAYFGTFVSVTDSKSNTYTTAVTEVIQSNDADARLRQVYKAGGTGGASHAFTLTLGSASDFPALQCLEITGAHITAPLDQVKSSAGSVATSHTTGTAPITTVGNEILIGGASTSNTATFSADTTCDLDTTDENIATDGDTEGLLTAHEIVSVVGTYQFCANTTQIVATTMVLGTYKIAAAAAGSPPLQRRVFE